MVFLLSGSESMACWDLSNLCKSATLLCLSKPSSCITIDICHGL